MSLNLVLNQSTGQRPDEKEHTLGGDIPEKTFQPMLFFPVLKGLRAKSPTA